MQAHEAPNMQIEPKMNDTMILAGMEAKLVCNITHDNEIHLNIKWFRNKDHISHLSSKIRSSISIQQISRNEYHTESSLTIRNATKKHSGNYTCLVETEVDFDQSSSKVKVKLKENFLVVYISVSLCLMIATVTYLTYPYCIRAKK